MLFRSGDIGTWNAYVGVKGNANKGQSIPAATVKATRKSNAEIAQEVIAGKWGDGNTRKVKLAAAGYDYNAVQAEVNRRIDDVVLVIQKDDLENFMPLFNAYEDLTGFIDANQMIILILFKDKNSQYNLIAKNGKDFRTAALTNATDPCLLVIIFF